jgi:hypothetical protein
MDLGPALANEYIAIVKLSSLVSVISLTEILMVGQQLYSIGQRRQGDAQRLGNDHPPLDPGVA